MFLTLLARWLLRFGEKVARTSLIRQNDFHSANSTKADFHKTMVVFFYLSCFLTEHANFESLLSFCGDGCPLPLHICHYIFCRVSKSLSWNTHQTKLNTYRTLNYVLLILKHRYKETLSKDSLLENISTFI